MPKNVNAAVSEEFCDQAMRGVDQLPTEEMEKHVAKTTIRTKTSVPKIDEYTFEKINRDDIRYFIHELIYSVDSDIGKFYTEETSEDWEEASAELESFVDRFIKYFADDHDDSDYYIED